MTSKLMLIFILALILPAQGFAWGDLGHQVVGEIADRLLDPPAKKKVKELLAKSGSASLAEAGSWPDLMRSNPDFKNTRIDTWHYATIDSKTGGILDVENVIYGITLMEKILSTNEPYKVPKKDAGLGTNDVVIDAGMAIKFLTHFIGDVHQPLHVGNDKDYGANNCLVKWFGAVRKNEGFWNLHMVWDEGLVESTELGQNDLADAALARLNPEVKAEILSRMEPTQWALDSADLRQGVYPQLDPNTKVKDTEQPYCSNPAYAYAKMPRPNGNVFDKTQFDLMESKLLADPQIPRLGYDYRYAQMELVKRQLLAAGVRLSAKLNKILAARPKSN